MSARAGRIRRGQGRISYTRRTCEGQRVKVVVANCKIYQNVKDEFAGILQAPMSAA
jgi:hypothetical protein